MNSNSLRCDWENTHKHTNTLKNFLVVSQLITMKCTRTGLLETLLLSLFNCPSADQRAK